jgi:hypothetical protein
MSRPRKLSTQPPIRDLLQSFRSTNNSDRSVTLIKQMLHGEAPTFDVINRHRAEVRFVSGSIQQDNRNSAQLELPNSFVDTPDRREQDSPDPLLHEYEQLSALAIRLL